jgi:uncharacterized protein (DUF697 family)
MAQTEIIKWVVFAFGGTAFVAAAITWIALYFLRKKFRRDRSECDRTRKETKEHPGALAIGP